MGKWISMFAARKPVYERLADLVLDVREGTIAEIGRRLEAALREFAAAKQEVEK
jgi:shikimate kinase